MLDRLRTAAPLWRRALRRRRRLLAVLMLAALTALVVPAALPPGTRGVEVVVAAGQLALGSVIAADDLRLVTAAPALVPEGATGDPGELTGKTIIAEVAESSPVLPGHVAAADESVATEGMAQMVVPVDAALGPHVAPGSEIRIDVSTPAEGGSRSLDAVVVDTSGLEAGSTAGLPGAPSGELLPMVVAVDPHHTADIAHGLREGWLTVSIIG